MSLLENIYDNSPIFFQNFMITIKGYHNNYFRYGKVYHEFKTFLSDFDTWDYSKKVAYQEKTMQSFLNYVIENSPYYKKLYSQIDLQSIKTVADLKHLPIIEKEIIRENIDDIVTINTRDGIENHTGGTTGKSLVVLSTLEDNMKDMALIDHYKERVGFQNRKMKRATFNGKHIIPPSQKKRVFWRYNIASKQLIFSSFHLSEKNLDAYVKKLNNFKPVAIDGFLSSICDIASYIERNDCKLKFTPIAIFPTSETLTDDKRELIERVFGCKVFNQYGSSERGPVITECKKQHLHIEMASGIFEYINEDSQEVLVTSFTSHGTPLVRYRIGDVMILEDQKNGSKCELSSPIVKEIHGRNSDFLYTAEGAKIVSVNIANAFKNIPNSIIRAQLLQNEIGKVTVLLEVDKKKYKKQHDERVRSELLHKMGKTTTVTIKHVDEIPREKSGKYRLIKNLLAV